VTPGGPVTAGVDAGVGVRAGGGRDGAWVSWIVLLSVVVASGAGHDSRLPAVSVEIV